MKLRDMFNYIPVEYNSMLGEDEENLPKSLIEELDKMEGNRKPYDYSSYRNTEDTRLRYCVGALDGYIDDYERLSEYEKVNPNTEQREILEELSSVIISEIKNGLHNIIKVNDKLLEIRKKVDSDFSNKSYFNMKNMPDVDSTIEDDKTFVYDNREHLKGNVLGEFLSRNLLNRYEKFDKVIVNKSIEFLNNKGIYDRLSGRSITKEELLRKVEELKEIILRME